jgi:hypothetical protein
LALVGVTSYGYLVAVDVVDAVSVPFAVLRWLLLLLLGRLLLRKRRRRRLLVGAVAQDGSRRRGTLLLQPLLRILRGGGEISTLQFRRYFY